MIRYQTAADKKINAETDGVIMKDYVENLDEEEDLNDSMSMVSGKQNYAIGKLNEVFKLFHLEPAI